MFGYIRPLVSELKVREFEQFKSCYCGLCHTLDREYGLSARFILNYDFVFLTMLLWDSEKRCEFAGKRCIVSPCRKKCVCVSSNEFDIASGLSIILTYWKLQDSVRDDGFFKAMLSRGGKLFLRRGYKKAAKRYPDFDLRVRQQIELLDRYENCGEKSIDKTADTFAKILSCIAETISAEEKKRELELLLYHVGRWIYITDAANDIKEDFKNKSYNPLASRFELSGNELGEKDKETINMTLMHSENIAISAFSLMQENPWFEIIKNILYFGMPDVRQRVLNWTFKNTKEGLPK